MPSNFFPQTMADNDFDTSPSIYEDEFGEALHNLPEVSLMPTFRGDKFKSIVQFPIIVEAWDKVGYGRGRRGWLKEFSKAERTTIYRWAKKFYRWHLVTGTPLRVQAKMSTVQLLQRAVGFFAGL